LFSNTFLLTIQKNLYDISDPRYIKFRFSNNNNSIDASVFHRDDYNYTDSSMIPIYTALCYFDKAELEIIPGSHIKNNLSLTDLYKRVSFHFETNEIKSLFIITPRNEKIMVPISGITTFRQFLMSQINDSNMVPIYPLPAHIVYRIYVDDGYCNHH